ncbi:uncharacterized protein [Battus philenor]|uniref:uncharacterized protein n=1 Tax=Battus philenor TaxID=42288 RepID=UPI0035D0EA4F
MFSFTLNTTGLRVSDLASVWWADRKSLSTAHGCAAPNRWPRTLSLPWVAKDEKKVPDDSDNARFQREELFKHNNLRNCKKKLALTVKMTSEPGKSSGDEYIPIEHVFDGSKKKRVRLLDPFVLRLRRDEPLQAYKIRRIDENSMFHDKSKKFDEYDTSRIDDGKCDNLRRYNINKKSKVGLYDPYKAETFQNNQITSKENFFELNDEPSTDYFSSRNIEKHYAVYEIGNPDLWYTVHLQLYEKSSTPEGKIVWNDITKEEVASVSTLNPEWSNSDMSIQYRPAEWLSREEFSLPKASLCLLIPLRGTDLTNLGNDGDYIIDNFGEFLVLTIDELVTEEPANNIRDNSSNLPVANVSQENKTPRRVLIRASRALMGGSAESLLFASKGSDQYMMIPHRKPHHSQIDVESRADGNELIHVGSLGRIMTAVSDSSRRTRTVLTLQVTNTGLAAARFRVAAKDCGPGSLKQMNDEGFTVGPALLSPKHTHRFLIELPFEIPDENTHCYVSLLNDDDDSVAVRDVAIKKGDRCFCVWHCDCVCLSDDPKLICREMSEAQQSAAGLTLKKRPRKIRSVCNSDNVTTNIFVIVIGVLAVLLALGFTKAILGLAFGCIGFWGLEKIVKMPRMLDHYYESSLRYRPVTYDIEGWPIHPDTKKRNVRSISRPMEFMLNIIFFVAIPCVIVRDTLRSLTLKYGNTEGTVKTKSKPPDDKKVYNTRDIQMRPLLHEESFRKSEDLLSSCADSEQEDTEYVLMQMQKSRESLAVSQYVILT